MSQIVKLAEKLRRRSGKVGAMATLKYLVGVYILPRMGLQFKRVYSKKLRDDVDASTTCGEELRYLVAVTFSDLSSDRLKELVSSGLVGSEEECVRAFDAKRTCVIIFDEAGSMTGVLWLEQAPSYLETERGRSLLIRDLEVLPVARGRGLARKLIRIAAHHRKGMVEADDVSFFANILVGNQSSTRVFIKEGYISEGFSLTFFGKGIFCSKCRISLIGANRSERQQ